MSIVKRVTEAAIHLANDDPEAALLPLCVAIDATAKRTYSRGGHSAYKRFLASHMPLITKIAFGGLASRSLRFELHHPDIELDPDGMCSLEQIVYHIVRSGLVHEAEVPPSVRFSDECVLRYDSGALVIGNSFITGLLMAVITAPVNRGMKLPESLTVPLRARTMPLLSFIGAPATLHRLYEAE